MQIATWSCLGKSVVGLPLGLRFLHRALHLNAAEHLLFQGLLLGSIECAGRQEVLSHVHVVAHRSGSTTSCPHNWLQLVRWRSHLLVGSLDLLLTLVLAVRHILDLVIDVLELRAGVCLITTYHLIHLLGFEADSLKHLLILNFIQLTGVSLTIFFLSLGHLLNVVLMLVDGEVLI